MAVYLQTNQVVNLPAAATYVISAADSGKLHVLAAQGAGGCIITLPTPATGLHFRFQLGAVAGGAITFGTGVANGVRGVGLTANSTVILIVTSVTIGFIATAAIGDWVEFCGMNATTYSVSGMSSINGGLAIV